MASGNQYDLVIQQGATFSLAITWKDSTGAAINLTGYTARMQARSTYDATTSILSLTSASGDIVLGGAAGTITITASATITAALTAPFSGVFDLELVSGSGVVTRLLEGAVSISPEVTR